MIFKLIIKPSSQNKTKSINNASEIANQSLFTAVVIVVGGIYFWLEVVIDCDDNITKLIGSFFESFFGCHRNIVYQKKRQKRETSKKKKIKQETELFEWSQFFNSINFILLFRRRFHVN